MPLLLIACVGAPVRQSAVGGCKPVTPCAPASTARQQRALCRTPQPPCVCLLLRVGVRSPAARTRGSGRRTSSSHHSSAAWTLNAQQCAAAVERRRAKASREHASTTNARRARALEAQRAVRCVVRTTIASSPMRALSPAERVASSLRRCAVHRTYLDIPTPSLRLSAYAGGVGPPPRSAAPGYACRLPRRRRSAACAAAAERR